MPRAAVRKERTREEAVAYAVANRIRVEVLQALNECSFSIVELSRIIHQPMSTVGHHVEELLKDGSIEVAGKRRVRAIDQVIYRAIEMPIYDEAAMAALEPEARQEIYGLTLQNATAEAMASFFAGKFSDDPETWIAWRWFNVDEQGRREIHKELEASWSRVMKIEAGSMERSAAAGDDLTPIVVSTAGFERSRSFADSAR